MHQQMSESTRVIEMHLVCIFDKCVCDYSSVAVEGLVPLLKIRDFFPPALSKRKNVN